MQRANGILVGIFVLAAAPAFAQANVAGDWDVTLNSPQGATTIHATLKQDGEKVSGVLKSAMGELPFDDGKLVGTDLTIAFSVPFQGTPLLITLTGKVADTAIDGKADFGGMAEGEWSAKRPDATAATNGNGSTAAPTAATASAGGIVGKWDVTFKTPQGDFPATVTITNEAGKLSGTVSSQLGDAPISGTLDGAAVKLLLVANNPQGGTMNVSMTGEMQGDAIVNGMADVSGMGQMEWSARRAKQ